MTLMVAQESEIADIQLTKRFAVAAMCLLVYDTLIHLADEVECIWNSRSSWVRWTYAFIRHFPYLAQGTVIAAEHYMTYADRSLSMPCHALVIYQLALNEALTVAVEAVLIIRIYAMFNRNKMILTVLLVLFTAEVTATITILVLSIPETEFTLGCVVTRMPKVFTCYWIISLAFETVLFGFTLFKCLFGKKSHSWGRSVMCVLCRDGTWAFGVIFMIMLTNMLLYRVTNALAGLCFFWELSVMSFAGSHLLPNLRHLAIQANRQENSLWSTAEVAQFSSEVANVGEVYTASIVDVA